MAWSGTPEQHVSMLAVSWLLFQRCIHTNYTPLLPHRPCPSLDLFMTARFVEHVFLVPSSLVSHLVSRNTFMIGKIAHKKRTLRGLFMVIASFRVAFTIAP